MKLDVKVPAEDILHHVAYEAYGNIPFGWHVLVLKDREALSRVRSQAGDDSPDAYAWTLMHNLPDDGRIGEMYFVAGSVYVGMVAHEALHLASWMCRYSLEQWPVEGRAKEVRVARMTMGKEPEQLAEITGELTSVTWYNLERDGMVDVDE